MKNREEFKTFEDYLTSKHSEFYVGCDDDMPDDFEKWLTEIQVDDFIAYADDYADGFRKIGVK